LLDELIVLNRPLDADEIHWIHEQGSTHARELPTTAPAR